MGSPELQKTVPVESVDEKVITCALVVLDLQRLEAEKLHEYVNE